MEDLPMFVKDAANNKMLINQPSKISESDCNKDLCMTFNYIILTSLLQLHTSLKIFYDRYMFRTLIRYVQSDRRKKMIFIISEKECAQIYR